MKPFLFLLTIVLATTACNVASASQPPTAATASSAAPATTEVATTTPVKTPPSTARAAPTPTPGTTPSPSRVESVSRSLPPAVVGRRHPARVARPVGWRAWRELLERPHPGLPPLLRWRAEGPGRGAVTQQLASAAIAETPSVAIPRVYLDLGWKY